MKVRYHRDFEKAYLKLHWNDRIRLHERIRLFSQDAFHPLLNNHALHGKFHGYRSINIGGNLRAIYRELNSDTAHFIEIGTHNRLYK